MDPPPVKRITQDKKFSHGVEPGFHRDHRKPVVRSTSNSSRSAHTIEEFQALTRSFSPAQPAKNYERRPRHKIREDRYELKERGKQTKGSLPIIEPQRKKRKKKSKVKRRDSYENNFTAQNVVSDRLTVRCSHKASAIQGELTLVDQTNLKYGCV